MDELTSFLQKSANLYKFLTSFPEENERTEFIEKVNSMLNERGEIVEQLKASGFKYDAENSQHKLLFELDAGINERLLKLMDEVKADLKELQVSKTKEMQYINPYGELMNREGRYYDGKK
jgi:flagellar protein FliT